MGGDWCAPGRGAAARLESGRAAGRRRLAGRAGARAAAAAAAGRGGARLTPDESASTHRLHKPPTTNSADSYRERAAGSAASGKRAAATSERASQWRTSSLASASRIDWTSGRWSTGTADAPAPPSWLCITSRAPVR